MRTDLRIVAGSLRGRKVICVVDPSIRPTPDMVRQALFNILGNAVPARVFIDLFAGTGVVGLEALSRGAKSTLCVERDFQRANEIEQHASKFGVAKQLRVLRVDAYRWVERWQALPDPVTVFISPPFADYDAHGPELSQMLTILQAKVAPDSVLVLQMDKLKPLPELPCAGEWDQRNYGRNQLFFWVKSLPGEASADNAEQIESDEP